MKLKPIYLLMILFAIITLNSCKFYFSESDYIGTYYGDFTTYTSVYKSCNGYLIITDAGENIINIEVVTDSNTTFYYYDVPISRGHSLNSSQLNIDGGSNLDGGINRNSHTIYLHDYSAGYATYRFYGKR